MSDSPRHFGLWSGIGLVVANMVGVGVFLSTGFMAQDLTPKQILLAWLVGAVLALCGARAYAEVARLVPRSGGEYRFLSTLIHPSLGYLAGWASLVVGFSQPIAADALAAGAFFNRLGFEGVDPRVFGSVLLLVLTVLHGIGLHLSARAQNVLVAIKVVLLVGFVGVGVALGPLDFPTWVPPGAGAKEGFPLDAFVGSLFFIAFAFSGWNAAVYASEEFENPERTVPRAMLIGCAAVAVLYLVVNYIFVANLDATGGQVVFRYDKEQVTLGHAVMEKLLGAGAAKVMSAVILLAFVSAMSAMTLLGPRVYVAMAKDGFLPQRFATPHGKAPVWSLVLQQGICLIVIWSQPLKDVLSNVGAILTLFAALTVVGLFRARLQGKDVSVVALLCGVVYTGSAGFMLYRGFANSLSLLAWVGAVAAMGFLAWFITTKLQPTEAKS